MKSRRGSSAPTPEENLIIEFKEARAKLYLFRIALILGVSALFLYYCGFGVTKFLLPARLKENEILVMPLLGIAVVVALSHYASFGGMGARSFVWVILAATTLVNAIALARRHRLRINSRENAVPIVLAIGTMLLGLAPLFSIGYLTTIGPNVDSVGYAGRAQYFLDSGLVAPKAMGDQPWLAWVLAWLNYSARLGDVFFVASISALTGFATYEILTVTSALCFSMIMFSIHTFCRSVISLGRRTTALALTFVALNSLLLWAIFDGFYSQTVAFSLVPLVLTMLFLSILRREIKPVILLGLTTSALLSVYPWTVLYLMTTPGILVTYTLWQPPLIGKLRLVLTYATGLLLFLISLIAFNAVGVYRSIGEIAYDFAPIISRAGERPIGYDGDISTFVPLTDVYGLVNHIAAVKGVPFPQLPYSVSNALMLIAVGVSVMGLFSFRQRQFVTVVSVVVPLTALSLFQLIHGYPYGFFKSVSLLSPFLLILLASGISSCVSGKLSQEARWGWIKSGGVRKWTRRAATAFCLVVVPLELANSAILIAHSSRIADLDRNTIQLQQVLDLVPDDAQILVDAPFNARQTWIGQVLRTRSIAFRPPAVWGTSDGTRPQFYAQPYLIVERSKDAENKTKNVADTWNDPSAYDVIWENPAYLLKKRKDQAISALYQPELGRMSIPTGASLSIDVGRQQVTIRGQGRALNVKVQGEPGAVQLITAQTKEGTLSVQTNSTTYEAQGLPLGLSKVTVPTLASPEQIQITNTGSSELTLVSFKVLGNSNIGRLPIVDEWHGPSTLLWSNELHVDASLLGLKSEVVFFDDPVENNASKSYTLSLDVYDADKPSHPQGHFGFWNLELNGQDRHHSLEMTLDPNTKSLTAKGNRNKADVGSWVGTTGDGRYRAWVVLRARGNDNPLAKDDVALFEIRNGKVVRMEVKQPPVHALGLP